MVKNSSAGTNNSCTGDEHREALSRFGGGVTVITGRLPGGEHVGVTATAVVPVSSDPPLLLVCLARGARSLEAFTPGRQLAVSVLAADQAEVATVFGASRPDKFERHPSSPGLATRLPLLHGAGAHLECEVSQLHDGGDHLIVIARVMTTIATDSEPLIYHRRQFGTFQDAQTGAATPPALTDRSLAGVLVPRSR